MEINVWETVPSSRGLCGATEEVLSRPDRLERKDSLIEDVPVGAVVGLVAFLKTGRGRQLVLIST